MTDYFWREDSPWLVLQRPDGRRVTVPVAWTDLPTDAFPTTGDRPVLLPQAIVPMASACRRLRPTPRTRARKG